MDYYREFCQPMKQLKNRRYFHTNAERDFMPMACICDGQIDQIWLNTFPMW